MAIQTIFQFSDRISFLEVKEANSSRHSRYLRFAGNPIQTSWSSFQLDHPRLMSDVISNSSEIFYGEAISQQIFSQRIGSLAQRNSDEME
jgi:hypothetical protein